MITRKLDDLGRVVIPKEIRSELEIKEKEKIQIDVNNNCIILKKYQQSCILCGKKERLFNFKTQKVCIKCYEEMGKYLLEK